MEAELVRAIVPCNRGMNGKIIFKFAQVADVIDTLLEVSHVARRKTHPADAEPFQLRGNVHMLGMSCDVFSLVNRNFEFCWSLTADFLEVAVHAGYVRYRAAILHRRS